MQVCTSLQTDNHASTPPLSFLQAGCPSCRPTNSVNALTANDKALKTTTCQLFPKALYRIKWKRKTSANWLMRFTWKMAGEMEMMV